MWCSQLRRSMPEPASTKPRTPIWRKTRWCGDRAQAGHGWPALACWSQGWRNQAMRTIPASPRLRPKPVKRGLCTRTAAAPPEGVRPIPALPWLPPKPCARSPHCRGSSRSRQTPALFKLAGSGIPQSGGEPGKWVRDAGRSRRLQPAPANPAWRQASNTTTATALDRFRLRLCGRIGSRSSRSGGSASRISCGRPRVSGPNRKASPSA